MTLNRRTVLRLAGAAAAFPEMSAAAGATAGPFERMLVVNALGGLEDPNPRELPPSGGDVPSIAARVLADARASGVTAINVTIGYVFGNGEPFEESVRAVSQWDVLIAAHARDLVKVLTAEDIRRAKSDNRIGVILGFQNAAMLGRNVSRVDIFADLGVRVIQLTYNDTNALGGGSMSPETMGLTPFGREVVDRLNTKGVIIDLSHSGRGTCLDAVRGSRAPVAITHTGCRALNDVPRNKSDEELRLVASKGGFVGIFFMPFLTKGRNATSDDVVAHMEHAVQVCGEDHVGIGTDGSFTPVDDLDGYRESLREEIAARRAQGISAPGERPDIFPFAIDIRGPDQLRLLAEKLDKRGHSSARIEKIFGLNFVRYASEVWGA